MKYLIIGFYSCISHQNNDFINKENILDKFKIDSTANHFSYYKDLYIGNGLSELGNKVYFLFGELKTTIEYDNKIYLCNNDLTQDLINNMDAIIFFKHNKGIIDDILKKNNNLKQLFIEKSLKDKNTLYKPYLVCKTCVLPVIDFLKNDIKKGLGDIFDFFFLQTPNVSLNNNIVKGLMGIKKMYEYKNKHKDYLQIKKVQEYFPNNRANYSEMFVHNKINFSSICPFQKKAKYVIGYIGRLRQNYGMTIPFLMKLMSMLGTDFQLIILPGSFNLPHQEPIVKHNPKKKRHLQALKNYVNNKTVKFMEKYKDFQAYPEDYINNEKLEYNIDIFDPVEWGKQYDYLYHCDLAINFSPNRTKGYECEVANTKIFDYLVCGLPVITEKGCQNNYMINKYNAGIVINDIGSLKDYYNGINKIINVKYNKNKIINEYMF